MGGVFFPPVSFYNVSLRIHVFFFLREVPQKWGLFWSFSWTSEAFVAVTTTGEVTPTAEPKSLCSAHSHTRLHHLNLTVNYKQNCDASNRRTRHCNQPTNTADLVTLCWRYLRHRTPRRDQHLSQTSQRTEPWHTVFSKRLKKMERFLFYIAW